MPQPERLSPQEIQRLAMQRLWEQTSIVDNARHGCVDYDSGYEMAMNQLLGRTGFFRNLSERSRILEVGVGAYSYLNKHLIPQGAQKVAVDFSEKMIEKLKVNSWEHPYERYIVGDAR